MLLIIVKAIVFIFIAVTQFVDNKIIIIIIIIINL